MEHHERVSINGTPETCLRILFRFDLMLTTRAHRNQDLNPGSYHLHNGLPLSYLPLSRKCLKQLSDSYLAKGEQLCGVTSLRLMTIEWQWPFSPCNHSRVIVLSLSTLNLSSYDSLWVNPLATPSRVNITFWLDRRTPHTIKYMHFHTLSRQSCINFHIIPGDC